MAQATARHWNVRPLRDGEFEQLSQRMAEGSFQQSLGMRDMAQSHGARTSLVGVVDASVRSGRCGRGRCATRTTPTW